MSWLPGDVAFVTNSPVELNFSANGRLEPPGPLTPAGGRRGLWYSSALWVSPCLRAGGPGDGEKLGCSVSNLRRGEASPA